MLYPEANRQELKLIAKEIEKGSKEYGQAFEALPFAEREGPTKILAVFRNRHFFVQVHNQKGWIRISVNRTSLNVDARRWHDGISWDSLMLIKNQIGYGDRDAVEIYPQDAKTVNVANIRHLFILPENHAIDCIWTSCPKDREKEEG